MYQRRSGIGIQVAFSKDDGGRVRNLPVLTADHGNRRSLNSFRDDSSDCWRMISLGRLLSKRIECELSEIHQLD